MAAYSRKRLELTGQRFGKLTALSQAENIGSRTAWLCRCDCGRECVVRTGHLRQGHTASLRLHSRGRSLTYIDGTCVEMLAANTIRRNNTSGVPGVEWVVSKRLWRATIGFKGKRRYLGVYRKFEDAVKARKRAEDELYDPFLQEFAGTGRMDVPTADSNYGERG